MTGVLAVLASGPSGGSARCEPAFVNGTSADPVVFSDTTTFLPSASSYSWSRVSGDVVTVSNPTTQTTSFYKTLSPGETTFSIYRCTTPMGTAQVSVSLASIA